MSEQASKQTGSEDLSASKQAAGETFEAAIAPVEELADDVLTGYGRRLCEEAFERDPVAFAICVGRVLSRRNVRRPLALLVKIVDEDHALVSKVRRDRERDAGTVAIAPAERAERWMRGNGLDFQRDDARTILEDTFRLAGDEIERFLELYDELRLERADVRGRLGRSLREAAA